MKTVAEKVAVFCFGEAFALQKKFRNFADD